jgi:hypothetical protein
MALSNSERQARWRAKLKAQAAGKARLPDVFRDHMREVLLNEERLAACCANALELEIRLEAAKVLLARSDDMLTEVLNALIYAWDDDECTAISNARRRAAQARRSQGY